MKKQKLMAVVVLTALTRLFVGCNDDDSSSCIEDYTGVLSTEETAFAGEWNLTAIVSDKEVDITDDEEANPSTELFAKQTDCQNDQQYVFNTDRTLEISSGKTAEDCENPATISGTWKLGGSTLGTIDYCSEQTQELDFNSDRTTFSITTSNLEITLVYGTIVPSNITFTSTQAPVAEAEV